MMFHGLRGNVQAFPYFTVGEATNGEVGNLCLAFGQRLVRGVAST